MTLSNLVIVAGTLTSIGFVVIDVRLTFVVLAAVIGWVQLYSP